MPQVLSEGRRAAVEAAGVVYCTIIMSDIVVLKREPAPASAGTARPSGNLDADVVFRVRASTQGGQKKQAEVWAEASSRRTSSVWVMRCDEGERLGGDDSAPSPLTYFSAAIAF